MSLPHTANRIKEKTMLRASSLHLPPFIYASPLPIVALVPGLVVHRSLPSSPPQKPQPPIDLRAAQSFPVYRRFYQISSSRFGGGPLMSGQHSFPKATASFSSVGASRAGREILVQHLLVKEDDQQLVLNLQKRVTEGEDLNDLAVEYSICPSREEGGMLGWVRKGQMVPDFEEAAFSAPLNQIVKCKTKDGWHLLQVLSERNESILEHIRPSEFHEKMQDPLFLEEAQLIDVREPDEVAKASLPGFKVLPLRQFGKWGPEIATRFDPRKDTYVLCHHGSRSLQIARWLQMQGFEKVFNISGGIHEYSEKVDPSIPTY